MGMDDDLTKHQDELLVVALARSTWEDIADCLDKHNKVWKAKACRNGTAARVGTVTRIERVRAATNVSVSIEDQGAERSVSVHLPPVKLADWDPGQKFIVSILKVDEKGKVVGDTGRSPRS